MITNNENEKPELEGKFKINKKHCFFCNKMIDIYFVLNKEELIFYYDNNKTKIYTSISRNLVLAINRRLRKEEDKNKLSIYYFENEKSNMIKEIKLKAQNRYDMEKWISILNIKIKPKRFQFDLVNNNYVKSNDIYQFKNESQFYVTLCNLEYILLKNKMKTIFEIYRNTLDYSSPIIINDNNDDIYLINV